MTNHDQDASPTLSSRIAAALAAQGIDLENLDCCGDEAGTGQPEVKVICVPLGLGHAVRRLGESTREQVVMVRVDDATSGSLDDWVQTGIVKSRSAAAALFIREGLEVRAGELAQLQGALDEVEAARERLRKKASEVMGGSEPA